MKKPTLIVALIALLTWAGPSPAGLSRGVPSILPTVGGTLPAASYELPLARGVNLERMSWLGALGWMQLTVIRVDLGAQSLKVEPVLARAALSSPGKPTDIARENSLVAAVNGDFFDLGATGGPLSLVAVEGRVVRSPRVDPDFASIAITVSGEAIMGQWDWEGTLESADGSVAVALAAMNEISVAQNSAVLYTPEWTWPRPQQQPDAAFISVADGVVASAGIGYPTGARGTYVVARGSAANALRGLAPGDAVTVKVALRPGFDGLVAAFSGKPILVIDGCEVPGLLSHTGISAALPAPRTAAGITADGRTLIFAVVDGRLAGARGATLPEMAKIMVELGAASALNLDGGASSAVVVRDPATGVITSASRPSGAVERPVPYVIGVMPLEAPAEAPAEATLAAPADAPAESTPVPPSTASAPALAFIAVEVDTGIRVHTFPSLARALADNARLFAGDELVCPAGTSLKLRVVAFDEEMNRIAQPLPADPLWSVLHPKNLRSDVDAIAEVWRSAADGREVEFRPLPGSRTQLSVKWPGADGSLSNTVSFAVRSDAVPMAAPSAYGAEADWIVVEDFETDGLWVAGSSSPSVSARAWLAAAASWEVAQGLAAPVAPVGNALSLAFDLHAAEPTRAAYARAAKPLMLPEGTQSVAMWAWSDGNGHWLRATVADMAGTKHPLDFGRLNWLGWRFVRADLPEQLSGSAALTQIYVVEFKAELGTSGELSIDQVCALAAPRQKDTATLPPAAHTDDEGPATVVTIGAGPINWPGLRAELDEFKLSASRDLTVVLQGRTLAASPAGILGSGKLTMGGSLGDAIAAELMLRMVADCADGSTRVTLVQEDSALTESGETRAVVDGVLLIWRGVEKADPIGARHNVP